MSETLGKKGKANFGTAPVFLTAISTILGAVMFLRFGYAVGHVGLLGTIFIVLIGHIVTIATAMAIAEIATNQKVEGGGEYYIISRSFGLNIGSAIGVALYFSQAISVAFYIIAFAEAFNPVLTYISEEYGFWIDKRLISLPMMGLLILVMLTKGADLGVKALYVVVGILFISLLLFFLGTTDYAHGGVTNLQDFIQTITQKYTPKEGELPKTFFYVFAIVFPAFTGMTAGVGLSGDLKNPSKSIPLGTMAATIIGMVIYVFIAVKLAFSASPAELINEDELVMSKIALWGPIIPIGLAAATLSSALGSMMVAPRTLQALANDRVIPADFIGKWLGKGSKKKNEPVNASIVTSVIAVIFIAMGDVNAVAEVISMFFMVTYGAICTISFMEHFAADPSYRPLFRSRWYVSLTGAIMCLWLMFQMNPLYALAALVLMVLIYVTLNYFRSDKKSVATIFTGVIFQLSRQLHIFIQKLEREQDKENWRPSVVCISDKTFERYDAFEMLKWISQKYGFGTYIHLVHGYVSKTTNEESHKIVTELIKLSDVSKSKVYLDTCISPSYTSAIAQILQLPGVSGKENNMVMFEFPRDNPEELQPVLDNYQLVKALNFDVLILRTSEKGYGYRQEIHIWLSALDYQNANLMILLAYIILGHKDWKKGQIRIFSILPEEDLVEQRKQLEELVVNGRLPISASNIKVISQDSNTDTRTIINQHSASADLTVIGFRSEAVKHEELELFKGYDKLGNILFVNTTEAKVIK